MNNKTSLLWKITGIALSAPSYLLGTMHIKPEGSRNWKAPYLDKMANCEAFATEFDLGDADIDLIQQYAQLPDGQTLSDFIAPKKLAKLEAIFLKTAGLPLQALMHTKPLFIINLLTEKILLEENSISMDSELYQSAKEVGKELMGIETFDEQLSVLNQIPFDYQIKSLLKIGRNISGFRKSLKKMTATYEEGDVQKIHKLAKKGIGGMRKLMLYDRNQLMADRIFKKIQKKSIFCAIGAGHLGGKKGVLRLLKLEGLRVKAVV